MIEIVCNYKIQHDKKEPLNRYEKQKIKDSLYVGYKNGVVKKSNLTIEWKVVNKLKGYFKADNKNIVVCLF